MELIINGRERGCIKMKFFGYTLLFFCVTRVDMRWDGLYEQLNIEHAHHASHKGICGVFLESVAVRFRNHLIAYHIKHGASGNGCHGGE